MLPLSLLLAQSSSAAQGTTNQMKSLIAQITADKLAQAVAILLISVIVVKVLDKLIIWLSERVPREWRLRVKQFLPFVRLLVFVAATTVLVDMFLNLNRENLLAITGTAAVALGFAFKDLVSSIIAGMVGLFEAPYRIGDRIRIGDHYGEVITYGMRGIRLRTPSDSVVTIPHAQIWTNAVVNSNMGALEAQVVTDFYLAHDVDVALVKRTLYRVAYTSKYTQLKLPIQVVVLEKVWGTLFQLKCYPIDARNEFAYKTDLISRAKPFFARHQILYPRLPDLEAAVQPANRGSEFS